MPGPAPVIGTVLLSNLFTRLPLPAEPPAAERVSQPISQRQPDVITTLSPLTNLASASRSRSPPESLGVSTKASDKSDTIGSQRGIVKTAPVLPRLSGGDLATGRKWQ